MSASKRRWIIAAAVSAGFFVLVTANMLLIRWVREFRASPGTPMSETVTNTNAVDAELVTPPRGPRAILSTIPAPSFDDKEGLRENVGHLGYWDRNTWARYNGIDFGDGVSSVVAVLSCGRQVQGRTIYFHLDAPDGPVIAEIVTPATRGFEPVAAPVHGATGVHDVFLTCDAGGFNLESFKFIRPQSATNVIAATSHSASSGIRESGPGILGHTDGGDWIKYDQIDFGRGVSSVAVDLAVGPRDAKIEFHLDAPDGPLIGALVPISTGDWTTFQIQEALVQGAIGVHDLYLTFHGERGLPDIRTVQFKIGSVLRE